MNQTILSSGLLLVAFAASGQGIPPTNKVETEMPNVASGKQTYREIAPPVTAITERAWAQPHPLLRRHHRASQHLPTDMLTNSQRNMSLKLCASASPSKLTVQLTCPSGDLSSAPATNLMRWLSVSELRIFASI